MTHIEFRKISVQRDVDFYKKFSRTYLGIIMLYLIGIISNSWLIYHNNGSVMLHVLLGSLGTCLVFMLDYYFEARGSYKRAKEYLTMLDAHADIETGKTFELRDKINQLEGTIYAQRRNYESLRAANREASSVD